MAERLQSKPELISTMIPTWELGCKRATPGIVSSLSSLFKLPLTGRRDI
jgi:hypothetical protein